MLMPMLSGAAAVRPILLLCLLLSPLSMAKVYKWTDSQGKVHYSDKKPKRGAEDVSAQLTSSNTDSSAAEVQKLKQVFPAETAIEKQQRANVARQQQVARQKSAKLCQKLRKSHRTMQGKFYYVHKDGSTSEVKESERARALADIKAKIRRYCS